MPPASRARRDDEPPDVRFGPKNGRGAWWNAPNLGPPWRVPYPLRITAVRNDRDLHMGVVAVTAEFNRTLNRILYAHGVNISPYRTSGDGVKCIVARIDGATVRDERRAVVDVVEDVPRQAHLTLQFALVGRRNSSDIALVVMCSELVYVAPAPAARAPEPPTQGLIQALQRVHVTPECVVCMAAPSEYLLPCKHICTCVECGETLAQCPLCRAEFK